MLQGGGEPAGTFLPNWLTGYAFLFPTTVDLQRARQSRGNARVGPAWSLAADASDQLSRVIAARIVLNARDAGVILLEPSLPTNSKVADIRLVRMPLPSLDARVALSELAASMGLPSPKFEGDPAYSLYAAESALLQSQRVIPFAAFENCHRPGRKCDGLAGRSGRRLAFAERLAGNGEALSFRRKLLLVFALTVFLCVGAVAWIVSAVTRRAFERANEDQTAALVAQFRREFNRRGDEVAHRVETIAGSEAATRMALAVSRGSADYSAYVNEAKALADNQQLDFLEFVDSRGTILSSAQWPAKFGYKENSLPLGSPSKDAFLRQENLPDGVTLSLSAIRQVKVGDKPLYVIGVVAWTKTSWEAWNSRLECGPSSTPTWQRAFIPNCWSRPREACHNRSGWRPSLRKSRHSGRKPPRCFIGQIARWMMRASTPSR